MGLIIYNKKKQYRYIIIIWSVFILFCRLSVNLVNEKKKKERKKGNVFNPGGENLVQTKI